MKIPKDALRRAARTFGQAFVGVLALTAIPVLRDIVQAAVGGGEIKIDLNAWQNIALAALAGGFIALISWAQNMLEDKGKLPAVLKPEMVTKADAKEAVEKAFTADPTVDPMPTVKN